MSPRSIAVSTLALALTTFAPAVASADKLERPTITVSKKGNDLEIVVHNVTDYCVTDADPRIVRTSDSIRILRERPSKVSRCLDTRDLTFVARDIGRGRYTVSYERIPLVAPPRWIQVASTTAYVE